MSSTGCNGEGGTNSAGESRLLEEEHEAVVGFGGGGSARHGDVLGRGGGHHRSDHHTMRAAPLDVVVCHHRIDI